MFVEVLVVVFIVSLGDGVLLVEGLVLDEVKDDDGYYVDDIEEDERFFV